MNKQTWSTQAVCVSNCGRVTKRMVTNEANENTTCILCRNLLFSALFYDAKKLSVFIVQSFTIQIQTAPQNVFVGPLHEYEKNTAIQHCRRSVVSL